jgi:hypothetical protein
METPGLIWVWGFLFFILAVNGRGRFRRPPLSETLGRYKPSDGVPFSRSFLNIALRFSRSVRA